MDERSVRRGSCLLCAVCAALALLAAFPAGFAAMADGPSAQTAADGADTADGGCAAYLARYADAARPDTAVEVDASALDMAQSSGVHVDGGVLTDEQSTAVFRFTVDEAGLYALRIRYTTAPGSGAAIRRGLRLDGEVSYTQAAEVTLPRIFRDDTAPLTTDARGNEYAPAQIEVCGTYERLLTDEQGLVTGALPFYLSAGEHTVTLIGVQEAVTVDRLTFCQEPDAPAYADVAAGYDARELRPAAGSGVTVEAEAAWRKSAQTLYPVADRTSALNSPADPAVDRICAIGGSSWRSPGQWISWQVQVEESGLYTLAFRAKQNFTEGQASVRALKLDGALPFAEAGAISFDYSTAWQWVMPGGDEPYRFYLEAGRTYTLTLENTLGPYAPLLAETQGCIRALQQIYRRVRMLVGTTVDQDRDHEIPQQFPEWETLLRQQYDALSALTERTQALGGGRGSGYGEYRRLLLQIESFLEDPERIAKRLDAFSSNISSLSDYVLGASEQPLLLDQIAVLPAGQQPPKAEAGFWQQLRFDLQAFAASFGGDYRTADENGGSLALWLTSGRDQAQVLRRLIDGGFTRQTGIAVDVRLVTADAILPAVSAGRGPDVAVGQERALPVRYGLRGALRDLSGFAGCAEVLDRFHPAAAAPFYVGDRLYGLPDTQSFMMMYCRTDVLAELGLGAPDTWQELYHCLYLLQQNGMQVGFPNIDFSAVSANNTGLFTMLVMRRGGALFTDDLSRTRLDEPAAVEAFTEWAELYTKYKVPQQMNHLTRFRTGEAPIVLADLSFYNTLSLYASEIRGLWQLLPVPGTAGVDGVPDRSLGSEVTAAVAFESAAAADDCWAFLRWWTQADTQTAYAYAMEDRLGISGRVPTANLAAFDRLAWPAADREAIRTQRAFVRPVPEIAASYVYDRYLCTAVRYTIERNADPREMLLEQNKKINDENRIRRREFGLS